jgi:cytoskeletal protein CcmA (bactofilin family)
MAIFGKDRERRGMESEAPSVQGERHMFEREQRGRMEMADAGAMSGTSAFLGKGTRVSGKLTFEGPVRIEGQVEGELSAHDTLTIGEGADVRAQVTGTSIVIHGKVTGDVKANKRLEIRAPGKLIGNITTPVLVIQEGVIFEGQCSMGAAQPVREREGKITPITAEKAEAIGTK